MVLVEVVLGVTPVVEVVEAMLVEVVLGTDSVVDDVVLVVLVDVEPPIVVDVLDDVLVEVAPPIVVDVVDDVLLVVGEPIVVVVVPVPSFTVTLPVLMECATPTALERRAVHEPEATVRHADGAHEVGPSLEARVAAGDEERQVARIELRPRGGARRTSRDRS